MALDQPRWIPPAHKYGVGIDTAHRIVASVLIRRNLATCSLFWRVGVDNVHVSRLPCDVWEESMFLQLQETKLQKTRVKTRCEATEKSEWIQTYPNRNDIIQDSTRIISRLLWIAIAGCSQVSPLPGLYELRLGATKLLRSGQLKPLGLNVPQSKYGLWWWCC